MKVCGVIAEFNPFHNGHKLLLDNARKCGADGVAVVMSGNFSQRGEPTLVSKWARTRAALSCGADLVIELPLPYAISSAERFAFGGVSILDSLSVVDSIMFGAECPDTEKLTVVAKLLCGGLPEGRIKSFMDSGISYAVAVERAVASEVGEEYADLLTSPNNILAIQYMRAITELDSPLKPIPFERVGAEHDGGFEGIFASASHIRDLAYRGAQSEAAEFMPPVAYRILEEEIQKGEGMPDFAAYEKAVLSKLRFAEKSDFCSLPDVSEGLHNRIASAVVISRDLNELYELIKSKRYTHSRIRRIVASAFLGVKREDAYGRPPYARVLGFNETGRKILSAAARRGNIPIITKYSQVKELDERGRRLYELECKATDQYNLFIPSILPCNMDKTTKLVRM